MLGQYSIAEAPIAALPTFIAPTVFRDINMPVYMDVDRNRTTVDLFQAETYIDLTRSFTYIDVEE